MRNHPSLSLTALLLLAVSCGAAAPGDAPDLSKLHLPDGFHIAIYADHLPGARSMALGERGTLFVGTNSEGKVYAVLDKNGDGRADEALILLRGRNMPNGVAVRDGALYVAEINRVLRLPAIE